MNMIFRKPRIHRSLDFTLQKYKADYNKGTILCMTIVFCHAVLSLLKYVIYN